MNSVSIAAGNILTLDQALELLYGYDSVVLAGVYTYQTSRFIDGVHNFGRLEEQPHL